MRKSGVKRTHQALEILPCENLGHTVAFMVLVRNGNLATDGGRGVLNHAHEQRAMAMTAGTSDIFAIDGMGTGDRWQG